DFLVGAFEIVDQVVEGGGHAAGQRSRASSVISGTAASAFETGQFSFAVWAACVKPSSAIPGTLPSTVSAIFVMPSPGWKVTVADVFSSSGGFPACARACESAIEKHDACAAAISSSGLVLPPVSSSERAAQLTARSPKAPLVVERIVPLPSIRLPFHVTSARRSVAIEVSFTSWSGHYLDATFRRALLFEVQDLAQRPDADLELVERRLARRQALEP